MYNFCFVLLTGNTVKQESDVLDEDFVSQSLLSDQPSSFDNKSE